MIVKLNKKGQIPFWLWGLIIFFVILGLGAIAIGLWLKVKARGG